MSLAGMTIDSRLCRGLSGSIETIDKRHVMRYDCDVIKTFANRHTQEVYETGKSKQLPSEILRRAIRRMEYLDFATRMEDLKVPPGNRLHKLARDREGQYSVSVNDQWRICFRFLDGDVYDVELTDYH